MLTLNKRGNRPDQILTVQGNGPVQKKKSDTTGTLSLIKMVVISKEEAACIFYCKEYNKENATTYLKRIEEMEEVDLCYFTDPHCPFLQCNLRIYGTPNEYRLYSSSKDGEEKKNISVFGI